MDRDKVTKPSAQIGFIKFILLPLVEALGELFPVIVDDVVAPVMNALDYYTKMQQELETEKLRSDEMKPPDAGTATRTGVGAADDAPITTIHKFKVHKINKLAVASQRSLDNNRSSSGSNIMTMHANRTAL